ncbi:MFS transporter [Enterobacter hormaechei]
MGSGCAFILAVLLFFAKTDAPSSATVANAVGANHSAFSLKLALELFRQPKLWFLSLYVIGVSCTYDVFDQQFANFFTSFFATGEQGTRVFGYVTQWANYLTPRLCFLRHLIINRIGGQKRPAAGWHYYVSTYYWLIVRYLSTGSGYSENAAYV